MLKNVKIIESENNMLFIFETVDGYKIESVLAKKPMCLCVSTHVGCEIGCVFCASGKNGCVRPLHFEEVLEQVNYVYGIYGKLNDVHFGGIGEPLNNLKNILCVKRQLEENVNSFSITTSIPSLLLFTQILDSDFKNITISLHSMRDNTREVIMPHSLKSSILQSELRKLSYKRADFSEKISIGYIMLEGINDSNDEIMEFVDFVKELKCALFPMFYNIIDEKISLVTNELKYEQILGYLGINNIKFLKSSSSRRDATGGCGTLKVNREMIEL